MTESDKLFRFEHLEVWQRAADLAFALGVVADGLTEKRLYRFAEQLRARHCPVLPSAPAAIQAASFEIT